MRKKHAGSRAARSTRTDLVIRPARTEDRAALEAIAAQIWEGDDYLPRVFDEWLADPHGGFFVAELHGQVIGAAKISRLSEGEWWLQGLRVDPAYQRQGIGRVLHHFIANEVRKYGTGQVRFSTASTTSAVHQLARETGFRQELMCAILHAPALDEPPQGWRALGVEDLTRVQEWLQRSAHFERMGGSLEWNWTFYRITPSLLRERLSAGLVYGWSGTPPEGVLILNPAKPTDNPPALKIGYLDVPDAELREAARDARRLAVALGQARVRVKPPKTQVAVYAQAGFAREWEGEVWLYARDLVLTRHAEIRHETPLPPNTHD